MLMITWVLCFSDFGFAADTWGDDEKLDDIAILFNFIVSVLSWIWILFAKIAWEFLTNKWVYWEIIWLDKLLWKYWVIVKNIANFWLWFYFIYTIFSAFISKDDIAKRVKDILIWLLIGWIWIQSSWFFTAAMIDVSTITLSAVWSLPSYILAKNSEMQKDMRISLSEFVDQNFNVTSGVDYILFPNDWSNSSFLEKPSVPIVWNVSKEKFIDMLMPNSDDVSGPLYYIWFAILKATKVDKLSLSSLKEVKRTILNAIILWWTTIVYSIEMWVLCVLALMRILYLWMFIVLSPFAILFWCVGKADKKTWDKLWWFLGSITKQLNFKSFFINIFKPTIIVLWMGIAMIFTVLMSGAVNENGNTVDKDLGWIHITSKPNGDMYDTTISSDFFNYSIKNIAKGLLDFIISVLTVILMYFIIKLAVGIWKSDDFVSKGIGKIQDSVHSAITSVPIIPMTWYDENWVAKSSGLSRNDINSLPSRKLNKMNVAAAALTAQQTDDVLEWLWFADKNLLTQSQKTAIRNAWEGQVWLKKLEAKRDYINNENNKIKSENWKWMVLNPMASDKFWIQDFTSWLNETNIKDVNDWPWKWMLEEWKNETDERKRDLKTLFDKPNHANTYANFFGYTSWNYANFDSIMNLDISEK